MEKTRPLILLTNDDGIHSPGLRAVTEAVCDLGELLIVAPATQQSGMGRSTPPIVNGAIIKEDMGVQCRTLSAYSLTGSPAQMVSYAMLALTPRRPDLVISGINYGENPGTCATSSGTVGAALQAAEFGIPALAVSLETDRQYHYRHVEGIDWRVAAQFTRKIAEVVLRSQLPFDVDVLKIDVPADAGPETPWRITRQSRQSYYRLFRPENATAEEKGGWVHLDYDVIIDWDALEPDSDIAAFARDRVISVTPLSHDLTSRVEPSSLDELLRRAA